jgi:hypothetical protein
MWWALRQFAPLVHVATGAPWSHGRQAAYVTAPARPPAGDAAGSVQRLIRRYLEGFGPASAQDIGQFSILRMPVVRPALAAMAASLVTLEGPAGAVLYDVPGAPLPPADTPAPPRLLGMWDSILLAYADRGRIVPPEYTKVVVRRNGDVLPAVLVDGYVAGVWRPTDGGIEVTAFHGLAARAWKDLRTEAKALVVFLADRDPNVYRRYAHWWDELPDGDVRVLRA